tara:strand:- start:164 stop:805 length:642 start_codon:yes stop_codon:yes gene_type:complete
MKELLVRSITSILLIITLYFSYIYNKLFLILLILISILSIIEYSKLIYKIQKKTFERTLFILIGSLYLIITVSFLFFKTYQFKDIIFYCILVCVATDIGGLVSGKIFKGKKLTKVSPKKTFAGFYGSFLVSFLTMLFFINYFNLQILTFVFFILTFSVCLLSQLGDLFFSYLKRKAKVKDTGELLPGHGGILDRIDGIIISVPINIFFYNLSI